MKGFADELVGDIGAVELRGVDVVDAKFDGAPQHRERLATVTRRPEGSAAGKLDGTEADAGNGKATEQEGIHGERLASSVGIRFDQVRAGAYSGRAAVRVVGGF